MTSVPSAPPPSYDEVITSGSYYPQTPVNFQSDAPPPYFYDLSYPPVDTQPLPPGPSAGGACAEPDIFIVRPPSSSSHQSNQILPKPSTLSPAANPTPDSDRTHSPNPAPGQSQPQNQNACTPSFKDKKVILGFFQCIYLILLVQAVSALAASAGFYSNDYLRYSLDSGNSGPRNASIGLCCGVIVVAWITKDLRRRNKLVCIIFMIVLTLVLSYAAMILACGVGNTSPLIFIGIVSAHSILMQIFIHQEKIAYTLISGMVFTFVTVSILSGISMAIFSPMMVLFGGPPALIFSWWALIIIWCTIHDPKNNVKPDQYLAEQPIIFAGLIFSPLIILAIIFCKFEWKKYK
ncbi:protein lifeguard 1-like [Pecten maximus]|uniref:protein lifeguard 1-like n=1 Tax=Pecten maximus TaxID=6579 RepID=UPI001458FF13|nr:protein lifeguard 1-like [Pecten maximus]XP_033728426.1 protein lifeguard 1-like [Pecten maximus]